jgi:uncharacterized protein
MAGVRGLQAASVPLHAIAVLSRPSLDHPDSIFDFFLAANITRIGFNIDEIEAANSKSSLTDPTVMAAARRFYERLLDRVVESHHAISVREFDSLFGALRADPMSLKNDQAEPYAILSVDWEGRFTTFSPELLGARHPRYDGFTFGDLRDGTFRQVETCDAFARVWSEVSQGVILCRDSCGYFSVCGGGAPSNKVFENDTFASSETMYCRLTVQAIVDAVLGWCEQDERVPYSSSVQGST